MFSDLKTYGIISILLILIMGYFVYINYRDNMILKNDIKEIKEFFSNGEQEVEDEDDDDEEDEYDEYEDQHTEEPQLVFEDVDAYFSHVKTAQLPVIEELPEEEPVVTEEKSKKRKPRKYNKKVSEVIPAEEEQEITQETIQ